jgi:pimeloyl-ACP methyl ester carboxylesterase
MSTWVFLRGLMRETRHWGNFPAVFSHEIAGADVVLLDLPGNGRLHQMPSPLRVEEMVEHCRCDLQARGIAPPYQVLALSLGAMVAVAWGARYPEELDGCVLINTSLRPFSPFYQRLRPRNYPDLFGLALRPSDPVKQEQLILRLTSCNGESQTDTLAAWVAYKQEYPVSRNNALRQLIAAGQYRAPARKPAPPMLILASAMDQLVNPRCSQHLASQWQTPLLMHPGAGHDLPLDDGPWVVRQVRNWLAAPD